MISEFDLLSEKIGQLASLAQALRKENADLKLKNTELAQENQQLIERIEKAHAQVAGLIKSLPVSEENQGAAE